GQLILAAILAAAILLGFGILYSTMQLRPGPALIMAFGAAVLLWVYLIVDDIRSEFVFMAPFVVTLIVVASRGQASRPPAQAGIPWRKGSQN
ncbi:MAG: ABC transporter permease, partial [Actinomycetota bacterium]|nr:ABC transporter permease [Actinomycetota bacterium]